VHQLGLDIPRALFPPLLDALLEILVGQEVFGGQRLAIERIRTNVEQMSRDDSAIHGNAYKTPQINTLMATIR